MYKRLSRSLVRRISSSSIRVGSVVDARPESSLQYIRGEVVRARSDQTFDIFFDDGEEAYCIKRDEIRLLSDDDDDARDESPVEC